MTIVAWMQPNSYARHQFPLGQQLLRPSGNAAKRYFPVAQREAEIKPHRVLDDGGRELVTGV